MRVLVLMSLFCACGRFGFGAGGEPAGNDGGMNGQADGSAATVWQQPWSTPTLWQHGDVAFNASPSLTGDGLELFYVSSRGDAFTDNDVYYSRFNGSDWDDPVLVAELAIDGATDAVSVSSDGLTIWTSRVGTTTGLDVWVSTRSSRTEVWSVPVLADDPNDADGLNTPEDNLPPTLLAGGLECIFASERTGTEGRTDLWLAQRSSPSEPWSNITRIEELSSGNLDEAPWISPDGEHFTFMSNRRPNNTDNGNDSNIYYSRRSSDGEFGPLVRLDEINSPPELGVGMTWDEDFSSNAAGTLGFLATNRTGGTATIYVVTR